MSLGPPYFTCGSASAAYDSDISSLLVRIPDNNQNLILAKDVRDPLWSLWNQIQLVASQSGSFSQAITYTTATPSSVTIGGILEGMTFSDISMQSIFDLMLHPFVPTIPQLGIDAGERQFGNNGVLNLSYYINTGSSPISTIAFNGPSNSPISPNLPTGNDPDIGYKLGIVPTYSSTAIVSQELVFTMSVTTNDLNLYTATASTIFKHKRYYGPITIPMGFTASSPSSVTAVQSYLTDNIIKGLSFSELATNVYFSEYMSFANQYFVFAAPTIMGEPPLQGFHVDFLFSTDYTKIKSGVTFSNNYGYKAPYDVWISNFKLNESPVLISVQNPTSFSNDVEVPSSISYVVGPMGPTGSDGSPVPLQRIAWGTGTGVTGSQYFEFEESTFNILGSSGSSFINSTKSTILGGYQNLIDNSSCSIITGGKFNNLCSSQNSAITGGATNNLYCSNNSFISGGYNTIYFSNYSSINGGYYNILCQSRSSVVVGGVSNRLCFSNNSINIGGASNNLCLSTYSAIIGGSSNLSCCSNNSTILGGSGNRLCLSNNSTNIGGVGNGLTSSNCSSVIGGRLNYLDNSNNSSVIGGCLNNISSAPYSSINGGSCNSLLTSVRSSINSGRNNIICQSSSDTSIIGGINNKAYYYSNRSIILGGSNNILNGSGNAAIINGYCNNMTNSGSSMIGGCNNNIVGSQFSSIIGGAFNGLTASSYSSIVGGIRTSIFNSCQSSIINGDNNNIYCSNCSSIMGGSSNTICNSNRSVILGGTSLVLNAENDTVLVPTLKIDIVPNENTDTQILTWGATGLVNYRDISTLTDVSHNAVFSSTDTVTTDRFIETGSGIPSNIVGHIVPINSTIDYLTYAIGVTGPTSSADIYINGVYSFGITMSNLTRIATLGLTQSVTLGDELSVYISGSVSQPIVNIHMRG